MRTKPIQVRPLSRRSHAGFRCGRRAGASGQALVLGLVMMAVLCIGLIVLFDTGQVVNKKVELTNAADAAAYSVAVQQARALNFAAYMNRARVANEVAIAQAISLYSWMNQMHTTSIVMQRSMQVLSAIPYVGAIFKGLEVAFRAAGQALKVARRSYRPIASTAVVTLDELNGIYARAATGVIDGVALVDGFRVAREVVQANSPNASVEGLAEVVLRGQLLAARNDYLDMHRIPRSGYGTGAPGSMAQRAGADRFRNVVMQSRDRFTRDRSRTENLALIRFTAAGGTDQVEYARWAAMDTMELRVNLPWPLRDVRMPLGWGGAQAVPANRNQRFLPGFDNGRGWYSDYSRSRHPPYGGSPRRNRTASPIVERDPNVALDGGRRNGAYFTGYNGLRDYHDVKSGKARWPTDGPVFTVYATTATSTARTSSAIDGIGGPAGSQFALDDRANGGKLAAIASAQVYFNRPPNYNPFRRGDGYLEAGNLFSPYWQARLVETPAGVRGSLGLGSIVGGS